MYLIGVNQSIVITQAWFLAADFILDEEKSIYHHLLICEPPFCNQISSTVQYWQLLAIQNMASVC